LTQQTEKIIQETKKLQNIDQFLVKANVSETAIAGNIQSLT